MIPRWLPAQTPQQKLPTDNIRCVAEPRTGHLSQSDNKTGKNDHTETILYWNSFVGGVEWPLSAQLVHPGAETVLLFG